MGIKKRFSLNSANSNSANKFNLYLKNHEIQQINQVLQEVLLLPQDEREDWISKNGEIVQSAFDTFIDDSNVVLENLSMDEEVIDLSQELIVSLRDTIEIVDSILSEKDFLDS